jgi:sterol desaturase/sphingolipid hydroxylase (fatty acid hydroxylase superfamily)
MLPSTLTAGTELAARLGAFLSVFALMAAWELAAPVRARRLPRVARWRANLGLAVLNTLILRAALPVSALALAAFVQASGWGLLNRFPLPGWAAVLLGVLLLDLAIYFQHVLFHAVPVLARLHAVHHADPDFDLTTGIRFHPVEMVLSALIKFAAVVALGAPVLAVLIFEVLLNGTAMFNHANVALPAWLEPWVRRALVTPDMHRIHHSVIESERNSNYGFCLSLWDRLLGTYTPAPRGELDIGLSAWRDPAAVATFTGVLGMPFSGKAP